jgi:hypothetical protein
VLQDIVGCFGIGGVMVMCWSWWCTDIYASTVGMHYSTPTSVKHSSVHIHKKVYLLWFVDCICQVGRHKMNIVQCLVEQYVNVFQSRA